MPQGQLHYPVRTPRILLRVAAVALGLPGVTGQVASQAPIN